MAKPNLSRADCIALSLIWLLLIIRCVLTGAGPMWLDELYAFRLIHDPSVSHMLFALGDQADGAPPLYYITAKIWSAVFSGSPLSLRLFTTIGFCVGLTLLWLAMRRAFAFLPTAFAFVMIPGHSNVIDIVSLEIRFYGLLFALLCLATYLGVRFCQSGRPSLGLLAANVLTNAALVLCHPLGGFYGAAILAAVILSDLLAKPSRTRPIVIGSYLLGWAALFLWFKQFLRQADINSPHSWIPVPSFWNLIEEVHAETDTYLLLLFFPLLYLVSILASRFYPHSRPGFRDRAKTPYLGYLLISIGLIGIVPLFWTLSHLLPNNSIFLGRYLLGAEIGWTMVLALVAGNFFDRVSFPSPLIPRILISVFALFALQSFLVPPIERLLGRSDPNQFLTGKSDRAFGHDDLPIVCPRTTEFMPRSFYASTPTRYYYLLDWQAANAPEALVTAVADYKLLSAIKRDYPDTTNIMDASEFLRQHPAFLLLDVPNAHWPSLYLKSNAYKITRLEPDRPMSYDQEGVCPMLLVERQPE